eukprot:980012-Rhodomonas_salina.1
MQARYKRLAFPSRIVRRLAEASGCCWLAARRSHFSTCDPRIIIGNDNVEINIIIIINSGNQCPLRHHHRCNHSIKSSSSSSSSSQSSLQAIIITAINTPSHHHHCYHHLQQSSFASLSSSFFEMNPHLVRPRIHLDKPLCERKCRLQQDLSQCRTSHSSCI